MKGSQDCMHLPLVIHKSGEALDALDERHEHNLDGGHRNGHILAKTLQLGIRNLALGGGDELEHGEVKLVQPPLGLALRTGLA